MLWVNAAVHDEQFKCLFLEHCFGCHDYNVLIDSLESSL